MVKNLLYFLPAILLVIVILLVEEGWVRLTLLGLLAISLVVAKYNRHKQPKDEVEYDERVKSNIHYFSFGFIVTMNALLICYILLTSQFTMNNWLSHHALIIYLAVSIFIPLYIIPAIAKRF